VEANTPGMSACEGGTAFGMAATERENPQMQMIPLRKVTSNLSLSQRDLNQSFIEGI
jgi:hypothetical protein